MAGGSSQIVVYFGSAATQAAGDYSAALTETVGTEAADYPNAEVLQMVVTDVDGDNWPDIVASFAGDSNFKRVYYGKRDGDTEVAVGVWPRTTGTRMGPASQDGWQIDSLEIVDLNLDGNLDVLYAAPGQEAYAALARSVPGPAFDAGAMLKQRERIEALFGAIADASVQSVQVTVQAPFHQPEVVGTINSECRSPADDFIPVQTRIDIAFPIVECVLGQAPEYRTLKDCILLDPITVLADNLDNGDARSIASCSYEYFSFTVCYVHHQLKGSRIAAAAPRHTYHIARSRYGVF